KCVACGHEQSDASRVMRCTSCGAFCQAEYDMDQVRRSVDRATVSRRKGGLWRFRELLPVRNDENIVTLGEGGTPLLRSQRLGARIGLPNLYFKDLTRNPTYSFKDYSSSTSVSK